jgi:hypothetical protein
MGRPLLWTAVLGVWLAAALPLALGQRTLFLRDVFATHLHFKAFGARELAAGRVPALNPSWGLGQPFRGNPNTLAFYPGNLLYLLLPFWPAFNLHYALHWLLALLTFHALARELGMGRLAALAAGLTYAGCGWMMSALTFYNILTVTAWWPLAMLGAHRGGRQGLALGGLGCGLALLGGEPVTATLGLVPLLVVAAGGRGWRRGAALTAGIGALGLLIALPQLVETLRIVGHTVRGTTGVSAPHGFYALHVSRFAELLVPPPTGWDGPLGHWLRLGGAGPARSPYVVSVYGGVVGLWLALLAVRRRLRWAALVAAGLALACLGGLAGPALGTLTAGLVRYPEKLLFWWALAFPLLVGWGLERARAEPAAARRLALGLALLLALALLVTRLAPGPWLAVPPAALGWRLGLAAALLLAAAAGLRSSAALVVGLQLVALLQHAPLWVTDEVAPYARAPEWARRLGEGTQVVPSTIRSPFLHPPPRLAPGRPAMQSLARASAELLEPPVGVVHGLRYPLASDLEGMHSPLMAAVLDRLPGLGWSERAHWLRALGAQAIVLSRPPGGAPLEPLDSRPILGARIDLAAVPGGVPEVWRPRRLVAAASRDDALRAVESIDDPVETAVVTTVAHLEQGRGAARLLESSADRVVVEVEGAGGVVALRRAFQPLLAATDETGRALTTVPVHAALLGVVVPAGRHRVVVAVDDRPTLAAGVAAFLAALGALGVALGARRRRSVS